MEFFVVSTLNGIIHGLLLFMVSAGLTLIFGMMGILNFAHASFYMLGAYFAYAMGTRLGFWPGLLVAPLLVALVGMLIERYLLRPTHRHGHGHELLITFGLALLVEEFIKLAFGNYPVEYATPEALRFAAFSAFGISYPFFRVFIGIIAVVMFGILYLMLKFTRVGIVVRASVERPAMVEALGHNVPLVFLGVFGVGAWMAGVAGVVGGAYFTVNPNMALELGVSVFVVVVVGGLGSLEGALVASLLIGLLSSFSVGIDYSLGDLFELAGLGQWAARSGGLLTLKISSLAGSMPVIAMLIVLMFRPTGLLGARE